jgi:Domain of Unknown Function (DUF748)
MRRHWKGMLGVVAGLIIGIVEVHLSDLSPPRMAGPVALGLFDGLIDEPLRRYVERQINSSLQGYTVRIGTLDVHPFSVSVDLREVAIMQDAHPDPPVVQVAQLHTSVQWRALLSWRLVADVRVDRPEVYVNLAQLRQEAADDVPVHKRGWQEALQSVMPLEVNVLRVVDGQLTYLDEGPFPPLRLSQLNVRAENIRNVDSQEGVYPSDFQVEGVLFDSGRLTLEGQADFLAVPHAAVQAQLTLEEVDLAHVKPVARRYNIALERGTLATAGALEYAPEVKVVHLRQATVQGLRMDYIHTAQTARVEKERAQQVKQVAQEVSNKPGLLLRADQVSIVKSQIGFVNRAADPDYRLFLADAEVHVRNFSNQLREGTMVAKVTGNFMGSGQTVVGATFRPETEGPNFALAGAIENTDMRALNQLLRAYGKFDVVQGFFSVYTEMRVKNRAVRGYVKPLVRELNVYDTGQDKEKGLFQKLYEGLVGGISELLENIPRDEVATVADISGRLENPQAGTWQVLVNLIRNAFFDAILPGFQREVGRARR